MNRNQFLFCIRGAGLHSFLTLFPVNKVIERYDAVLLKYFLKDLTFYNSKGFTEKETYIQNKVKELIKRFEQNIGKTIESFDHEVFHLAHTLKELYKSYYDDTDLWNTFKKAQELKFEFEKEQNNEKNR